MSFLKFDVTRLEILFVRSQIVDDRKLTEKNGKFFSNIKPPIDNSSRKFICQIS